MNLIKKNIVLIILLTIVFSLFINIYPHNIKEYNTWDADDGGAHIVYRPLAK